MKNYRPAPRAEGDPCSTCGGTLRYAPRSDKHKGACVECCLRRARHQHITHPRKRVYLERDRTRWKTQKYKDQSLAWRMGFKLHELPPRPDRCDCCGKIAPLTFDHDHELDDLGFTPLEAFRGWLCNDCNLGLGRLGDDVAGLLRALQYLKRAVTKHQEQT